MASPQNWFDEVPSFDLGIDRNSEDISLLVVEDSLDEDGDTNLIQDTLFEGEVMSKIDDEVTTKKTWVFEDVAFGGQYKNNFDLNKAPNEDGSSISVCGEVPGVMQSGRVKNLRQKIVQPCERAFLDLNMENFDLNEVPVETMDSAIEELKDEELENGLEIEDLEDEELEDGLKIEELENEELRKGIEDVLKIYIDSLN